MDASGGWMVDAACRDSTLDFNANDEAHEPDPELVAVCNLCPVRVECLGFALAFGLWGVWGGTSYWQRRQIRRRYRRAICPVCRVVGPIIEMGEAQACVACAVAWRATPVRLPAAGG